MAIRRGRGCRAVSPSLRAAGIVLAALALLGIPGSARAGEGAISDPRELGTHLDLKALSHTDDGSSVVYTAETYAPFTDGSATFKWGIDRDGDEEFDLFVFTDWRGGKLVGGVEDPAGRAVSAATVSRPGPNVIKVSFPVAALGGAGVYRYALNAGIPESEAAGDLAPDAGLSQHRLGTIAGSPGIETRANLPTTGPGDGGALLPFAGAALMAGGAALIAAAPRRGRRS